MDDFTFQEQLLTPRLATAGVGGVSSPAAPLWRSYLVPTLPMMLALLLLCRHWPVHPHAPTPSFPQDSIQTVERDSLFKVLVPSVNFSGPLTEEWTTKTMLHFSLSQQEADLFYWKALDYLNKPIKAHQINPWHRVNKKLALWSTPTVVIPAFVPSCLTSSLLSYWFLYNNKMTGPLIVRQLCCGPASEELLGKQTDHRPFWNAPTRSLQHVTALQKPAGRRRKLLLLSFLVVNDLLPALDFSWGVVVNSLSSEAEVKPLFKHALHLKMLCYYLNLTLSLSRLCPSDS